MKTLCLALTIGLSAVAVAALDAQTSTASAKPTTVTVTGCVERTAAEAPVGTSGTAGAAPRDTTFVLTAPSVPAATAGTSGGAGRASVAYRLDDADRTKVASHDGQKVEIAGTVEERGSQSSEQQTDAAAGSAARAPVLRVESIRMIASSCSK